MTAQSIPEAFDPCAWGEKCKQLHLEAIARSGCNYELSVESFSLAINSELSLIPMGDQHLAIQIAKEYDYALPDELKEMAMWSEKNGYCIHHFEFDCCPLGCGS